jgi:hypothetical protein
MFPDDFLNLLPYQAIPPQLAALPPDAQIHVQGVFKCRILNADGTVADEFDIGNAATTLGLNYLLDAGFRAVTPITTWYISLINDSGFSAVSAGDTMSSHAGWTELTNYTESTRPQWSPAAASGGIVQNTTAISFTISGARTVRGLFVTSVNTKGGTTGTLWATAVEAAGRALTDTQVFQVVYQVILTPVS